MKSLSRIQKLLALAASAALIGSACEAEAALSRAMIIAAEHSIEIAPLAAAAGVRLPTPSTKQPERANALTRTIDRTGTIEICTIGALGRTEVYMDLDGSGIRTFLGYLNEVSNDVYAQVESTVLLHARAHAAK